MPVSTSHTSHLMVSMVFPVIEVREDTPESRHSTINANIGHAFNSADITTRGWHGDINLTPSPPRIKKILSPFPHCIIVFLPIPTPSSWNSFPSPSRPRKLQYCPCEDFITILCQKVVNRITRTKIITTNNIQNKIENKKILYFVFLHFIIKMSYHYCGNNTISIPITVVIPIKLSPFPRENGKYKIFVPIPVELPWLPQVSRGKYYRVIL